MPYVLHAAPSREGHRLHMAYGSPAWLLQTSLLKILTSSTLQLGGFRAWRTPNYGRSLAESCLPPWPWMGSLQKTLAGMGSWGPCLPLQGPSRQLSGPHSPAQWPRLNKRREVASCPLAASLPTGPSSFPLPTRSTGVVPTEPGLVVPPGFTPMPWMAAQTDAGPGLQADLNPQA